MTRGTPFIVRIDMRTREVLRVERPGRREVGGVPLCPGHWGAVTEEATLQAIADEGRATRLDACVFPRHGTPLSGDVSRLCGEPATEAIGPAPACGRHFEEAVKWFRDRDKAIRDEQRHRAFDLREKEMRTWAGQGSQVVYYLRRASDGAIKIGTSANFRARLSQLSQEHGELQVLATHCGDYDREHRMHRKFASLCIRGEWFRPGAELLEWIRDVRRKNVNKVTKLSETVPLADVLALLRQAQEEQAA